MDTRFISVLKLIFFSLFIGSLNCAEAVKSSKPTSPVKMIATLLNPSPNSDFAEISVKVSSSFPSSAITVECRMPEGSFLIEGSTETMISGAKNSTEELLYKLQVDKKFYKITFVATIEEDGLITSAIDSVEINPESKPQKKSNTIVRKKLQRGGSVIEMRGE